MKTPNSRFVCHATPAAAKSARLDMIANMGQNVSFPEYDRELVVDLQTPQETAKVFHKYTIKIVSKNPTDTELRFWFGAPKAAAPERASTKTHSPGASGAGAAQLPEAEASPAARARSAVATHKINRLLNERIAAETDQIRFRAYYNDKMYAFCNVAGNVYVAWAEYVNYQNANDIPSVIYKGIPVLLVCNGYYSITAVYVFGKPACLHRNVCELMISTEELMSILCLEKSSPNVDVTNAHMITNARADAISLELVRKQAVTMDCEEMPFPSESDSEGYEFIKEERVKIDEFL